MPFFSSRNLGIKESIPISASLLDVIARLASRWLLKRTSALLNPLVIMEWTPSPVDARAFAINIKLEALVFFSLPGAILISINTGPLCESGYNRDWSTLYVVLGLEETSCVGEEHFLLSFSGDLVLLERLFWV